MSPAATIVQPPPPAPLAPGIELDAFGGFSISPATDGTQMLVGEIVNGVGTLVTVANGLSFSGVLSLLVGGPSGGTVTIKDGTGATWLTVSSPGTGVPVQRVTVPVNIPARGGSNNPLTVAVTGGAVALSAVAAGYTTVVN
jgi:hypothetical protein